jgi:hypothetical protein
LITTRTIMVMAKRQVVTITDDIDGRAGAQTVSFAYAKLEKGLEPFIAAARRVGGPGRSATRKGSTTATPDRQAVRAWAAEHGHEVSGRGRISKSVLEAYQRAH